MTDSNITNGRLRLPAEWEPQGAVQLTWPHEATDWQPILAEITKTYVEMAIAIARRQQLIIVAPKPEEALEQIRRGGATEQTMRRITVLACPTDDTWARDHGFITLTDAPYSDGKDMPAPAESRGDKAPRTAAGRTRLLDFCFNGWGRKFEAALDNAINRRMYEAGTVAGEYEDHLDFVLEGGSIESDGRGTVFTTTGCLTAPNRNQPLTRDDIEAQLKRRLHADRIVWIDHGNLTGDDTDGHIDTLVRVAPDDTLLYIGCDDPQDEQYAELRLMEEQLTTLRTATGQPFRLLRLPSPAPIYDADGGRLPATYANFLVINGAVLCPTYAQPDTDREALDIIGSAFPGREIVGIDCRSIIMQHGSLHCCTMQMPLQTNV